MLEEPPKGIDPTTFLTVPVAAPTVPPIVLTVGRPRGGHGGRASGRGDGGLMPGSGPDWVGALVGEGVTEGAVPPLAPLPRGAVGLGWCDAGVDMRATWIAGLRVPSTATLCTRATLPIRAAAAEAVDADPGEAALR